jgi:hypothetical protein
MIFQQSKSPLGITKAWSSGPGYLLITLKKEKNYHFPLRKLGYTASNNPDLPAQHMFWSGNIGKIY